MKRQQVGQEGEKFKGIKDEFVRIVKEKYCQRLANVKAATRLLQMVIEKANRDAGLDKNSVKQYNEAAQYLQVLQDGSDRQLSLINDLLELQQLEKGTRPLQLTAISLQIWIPQITEPLEELFLSQQLSLQIDISPEIPAIATDLHSLERIITELLDNAYKYTPPGETISVSARAILDKIQIKVRNSGIEIPAGELSRIFEKFYRIPSSDRNQYGGTGLGLTLARKIAMHLGGTIWVESLAGQTCFTVELPIQNVRSAATNVNPLTRANRVSRRG